MTELTKHIEALLLENDCVIIPNFGGFVANYSPAQKKEEENLFFPPIRSICFNPKLKMNDGMLAQSYMTVYNTNFSDATRMIEKEVEKMVSVLHEEGKVVLGNIGEIHFTMHNTYEFIPLDNNYFAKSFYGLEPFEMSTIADLQQQSKVGNKEIPQVWIPTVPKKKQQLQKVRKVKLGYSFIRSAAAILVGIILFFAYSTPVKNTGLQKNNYSQLLPSELIERLEGHAIPLTPVLTSTSSAQEHKVVTPKNDRPMKSISNPVKMKDGTDQLKREELAKQKPVEMRPTTGRYHIIVASSISKGSAEKLIETLKSNGYTDAKIIQKDNNIRVCIKTLSDRDDANEQMQNLRKKGEYKDAWVYIY
ncbi:MAG: SPOR domain-containing protein [Bacteroidaceae bacterium]